MRVNYSHSNIDLDAVTVHLTLTTSESRNLSIVSYTFLIEYVSEEQKNKWILNVYLSMYLCK